MRALLLLMAFVATPFALGAAQGKAVPSPFSDPANCGKHVRDGWQVPAHGGIHGVMDLPCSSGGGDPAPPSGTALLGGRVYHNISGRPGLAGWTVTLGGVVSRSAVTNQDGLYEFGSLPAGSYWICVVVPEGWVQESPTSARPECANGLGYTFDNFADGEQHPWAHFAMGTQ